MLASPRDRISSHCTAPLPCWQAIKKHPTQLELYKQKLVSSGEMSAEEIAGMETRVLQILNDEYNNCKDYVPSTRDWLAAYWAGFKSPEQLSRIRNTG